jgi:hypothetical protein
MGFLKDIRNLQEQADAMVAPGQHAGGVGPGSPPDPAPIQAMDDTGTTIDDEPDDPLIG